MRQWFCCLLLCTGVAGAGPLRGALLIGSDGTFLGTCDGKYGSDSLANKYSPYGSPYSSTSIFNKYGRYGGDYSATSPFNRYASDPPYWLSYSRELASLFTAPGYRPTPQIVSALRRSGAVRVTASPAFPDAVDPNVLRAACENP